MQPGDIVIAKITSIVGYGAFVSVGDYIGLVHISEFSDNYVKSLLILVIIFAAISRELLVFLMKSCRQFSADRCLPEKGKSYTISSTDQSQHIKEKK